MTPAWKQMHFFFLALFFLFFFFLRFQETLGRQKQHPEYGEETAEVLTRRQAGDPGKSHRQEEPD